jgi:DNA-binding protein HU-beta
MRTAPRAQMLDLAHQNLFHFSQLPNHSGGCVNKSELVDAVASAADIEKKKAEAAVDAVIDAVMSETKSGSKTSIFGFGTFSPTARAARMGRNPQTGAPVKIAASKGVKFSPASAFKNSLNGKSGAAKKAAPAKKSSAKKATAKKATAKKATKSTKKR